MRNYLLQDCERREDVGETSPQPLRKEGGVRTREKFECATEALLCTNSLQSSVSSSLL